MKIWAEYQAHVIRQDDDDWPDIWSDGYARWMRPHQLLLTFRQRADDPEPEPVRVTASCQKRWANSQRLTSSGCWYSATIWEIDGPIPGWLGPYVAELRARVAPVVAVA